MYVNGSKDVSVNTCLYQDSLLRCVFNSLDNFWGVQEVQPSDNLLIGHPQLNTKPDSSGDTIV